MGDNITEEVEETGLVTEQAMTVEELKLSLEHFQENTDVFFLITMGTIVFCELPTEHVFFTGLCLPCVYPLNELLFIVLFSRYYVSFRSYIIIILVICLLFTIYGLK